MHDLTRFVAIIKQVIRANMKNRAAIFGLVDGMTASVGVLVGSWSAHNDQAIIGALIGLAVAEGFGMGSGEFLSSNEVLSAIIIAIATAIGCLTPILAILIWGTSLIWPILVLYIAVGLVIGHLQEGNSWRNHARTFVLLGLVSLITFLVTHL